MTIVKFKRTKKDVLDEYIPLSEKVILSPRKRRKAREKLIELEQEWNDLL